MAASMITKCSFSGDKNDEVDGATAKEMNGKCHISKDLLYPETFTDSKYTHLL